MEAQVSLLSENPAGKRRLKSDWAVNGNVSSSEGRRGRFDISNAAIAVWMAAMFVSFGLLSNLIDQNGVLYNLGQGAFVALFMGAILLLARWLALRRTKKMS